MKRRKQNLCYGGYLHYLGLEACGRTFTHSPLTQDNSVVHDATIVLPQHYLNILFSDPPDHLRRNIDT